MSKFFMVLGLLFMLIAFSTHNLELVMVSVSICVISLLSEIYDEVLEIKKQLKSINKSIKLKNQFYGDI